MLRVILFYGLLFGVCAYAFVRGRTAERQTASVFLLGFFLTVVTYSIAAHRYLRVETQTWAIDSVMLAAMLFIALRSRLRSMALIAALQAVTVLAHLAKAIDPDSLRTTYKIALAFWSYPQLLILAYQTHRTASLPVRVVTER